MFWLTLLLASAFEIAFTSCLAASKGLTKWGPGTGFVVCAFISMYLLSRCVGEGKLPIGTAYAVWTGLGAAGTALIGICFFKEPATVARLLFLTLLIGSVVGLKFVSH